MAIGKTKEIFWQEAEAEYLKRLRPFIALDIVIISAGKYDNPQKNIKIEGERILARLRSDDFVIVLDRKGKEINSEILAYSLEKWRMKNKEIVFVIGGTFGLSPVVMTRANFIWSFSPLTFTHEMMRPILLEQIYRSFMISSGRHYHY